MKDIGQALTRTMADRKWRDRYVSMINAALADPEVIAFLTANETALDQQAIDRGAAKIYEFVNERDKIRKGELPLAPGYEPKLVLSDGLIDVAYQPTQEKLASDIQARQSALVTSINMPKDIATADLATYDATPSRQNALMAANAFVISMIQSPQVFHQGLYLTGPFGVGKTYLMGAIANALAQKGGIATTMIHVPTFVVEMRNAINDHSVLKKLDQLKSVPVLVLDDIGAESISAWVRDDVLGIILQYRMQEMLPTLFTSNKTMSELVDFLAETSQGSEPLKAQRIMERIRFLAAEYVVSGDNRRIPPQA